MRSSPRHARDPSFTARRVGDSRTRLTTRSERMALGPAVLHRRAQRLLGTRSTRHTLDSVTTWAEGLPYSPAPPSSAPPGPAAPSARPGRPPPAAIPPQLHQHPLDMGPGGRRGYPHTGRDEPRVLPVRDPHQDLHLAWGEHLQEPLALVVRLGGGVQQLTEGALEQGGATAASPALAFMMARSTPLCARRGVRSPTRPRRTRRRCRAGSGPAPEPGPPPADAPA